MIRIYTQPGCQPCTEAKLHILGKGFQYEEVDVSTDVEKRKEITQIAGTYCVPIIFVGDNVIIGHQEDKLEEALKNHR